MRRKRERADDDDIHRVLTENAEQLEWPQHEHLVVLAGHRRDRRAAMLVGA